MWISQRNRGALQADWIATNQLQGTSALKAYLAYATIIYKVNLMLSSKRSETSYLDHELIRKVFRKS